jgi:SpoVK/Ycf46/Vps4 family AAA+-type ATPase
MNSREFRLELDQIVTKKEPPRTSKIDPLLGKKLASVESIIDEYHVILRYGDRGVCAGVAQEAQPDISEGAQVLYDDKVFIVEKVIRKNKPLAEKPGVVFDDIGGLEKEKDRLITVLDYFNPEKRAEMELRSMRPARGVLLYGPPGTGKTMLAKAAANYAACPFYNLSASQLIDKHLGATSKNIQSIFRDARQDSPCILYIDEMTALGTQRAYHTSEGAEKEVARATEQFLSEMQGMNGEEYVLVMGSTNLPDALDRALVSRFDRKIYVPLPDLNQKEKITRLKLEGIEYDGINPRIVAELIHSADENASGRGIEDIIELAKSISYSNKRDFTLNDIEEAIIEYSGNLNFNNYRPFS